LAAGFNQSKQFQEERLNQVFKYFDADNSGSITYDEVLEFLSNYE
jgi:Ca2+-binding EF-hand superfamily protein